MMAVDLVDIVCEDCGASRGVDENRPVGSFICPECDGVMRHVDRARIPLDVKEIRELQTDDRGRPCLGQDYADQTVRIAVLEGDEQ